MKIKAQIGMVMNLDKCIGCHTCSVTCKNTWTNRPGAEYIYFNNVETKPGVGYPKRWEDQEKYRGGWTLRNGKLTLRSGSRWRRLANIFHNPDLPSIDDYFEPWTYDYETLSSHAESRHQPVARPHSLLTGERMELQWGPNWEDDLAGGPVTAQKDPNLQKIEEDIRMEFEQTFMLYLPRLCEHCINPACVSSCPSGAMYKRDEDGIVLVDQEACRGWRFCVSSCPYKKVYFNWHTHKAEKCTLCYPRLEAGMPTICSETCVGRIRYLGVMLYDADRVQEVASVKDEKELYAAQKSLFLNPHDPHIAEETRREGIPEDWLEAARSSPIYKLVMDWQIALPLHPEYRTLPMVWYIPPLSPLIQRWEGKEDQNRLEDIFPAIRDMRIPIQYLAQLLSAGDEAVIRRVLKKLVAMRLYMRSVNLRRKPNPALLAEAELEREEMEEMYRLLAIAKYEDRFVIPAAHREELSDLFYEQGSCGFSWSVGSGGCSGCGGGV